MSRWLVRASSLLGALLVLVSLSAGCGADTVLDAARYDQTCKIDGDCEGVLAGDMCTCSCQPAAISKSAEAAFRADDTAAREACSDTGLTCVACDSFEVACVSGKCTVKP